MPTQDIHVIVCRIGGETYTFTYRDCDKANLLRILGRFAADPELSFTWHDAAIVSSKVKEYAL
jgi:hypothetical protein